MPGYCRNKPEIYGERQKRSESAQVVLHRCLLRRRWGLRFLLRGLQPGILCHLLPNGKLLVGSLALLLELIIRSAEFLDSLLCKQLLESPLLDVLGFIFLQLGNERHGPL